MRITPRLAFAIAILASAPALAQTVTSVRTNTVHTPTTPVVDPSGPPTVHGLVPGSGGKTNQNPIWTAPTKPPVTPGAGGGAPVPQPLGTASSTTAAVPGSAGGIVQLPSGQRIGIAAPPTGGVTTSPIGVKPPVRCPVGALCPPVTPPPPVVTCLANDPSCKPVQPRPPVKCPPNAMCATPQPAPLVPTKVYAPD